jgi:hypothetical protein
LRLPLTNSNCECSPAAGISAATEIIWGFGTSRWQLGYYPTSGRSRGKRVNVALWPDSEVTEGPVDFRYPAYSGPVVLTASLSEPGQSEKNSV